MLFLVIPIIPILAVLAIFGGVGTLVWYSKQPNYKQDKANQLAMEWFGKRFNELAEYQQQKIKEKINKELR